jgi:hypothetical protein
MFAFLGSSSLGCGSGSDAGAPQNGGEGAADSASDGLSSVATSQQSDAWQQDVTGPFDAGAESTDVSMEQGAEDSGPGEASDDGDSATASQDAANDITGDLGVPPPDAPAPGSTAYAAGFYGAGVYRLEIVKWDPLRQLCFRVELVSPQEMQTPGFVLPPHWALRQAVVTLAATACSPDSFAPRGSIAAASQTGSVQWSGTWPCVVDLDVTLSFSQPPPGAPSTEVLRASGLAVAHCM